MIHIAYFQPNLELPSLKAHAIQILNTCIGLAKLKIKVDLWVNRWDKSLYSFYGLSHSPYLSLKKYNLNGFLTYKNIRNCYFYLRDARETYRLLKLRCLHKKPIIYETHQNVDYKNISFNYNDPIHKTILAYQEMKESGFTQKILPIFLKELDGIVCINESYRKVIEQKSRVPIVNIWYSVDLQKITASQQKTDGLLYLGNLYPYKGVEILIQAITLLKRKIFLRIVGGPKEDIQRLKIYAEKIGASKLIEWFGIVSYKNVGYIIKNSRVAIILNRGAKLVEYMAGGKTIIAPDLPSIRDQLIHDHSVYLFRPFNAASLAMAIENVYFDENLCQKLSRGANQTSKEHSLQNRAKKILAFLSEITFK